MSVFLVEVRGSSASPGLFTERERLVRERKQRETKRENSGGEKRRKKQTIQNQSDLAIKCRVASPLSYFCVCVRTSLWLVQVFFTVTQAQEMTFTSNSTAQYILID